MTKLWHDDIRRPPDDSWLWARTNEAAKLILLNNHITEASLDHDLGLHYHDPDVQDADLYMGHSPEGDGRALVRWMVKNRVVPEKVTIHSWNPPGAEEMRRLFADGGYEAACVPYERERFR